MGPPVTVLFEVEKVKKSEILEKRIFSHKKEK